MSATTDVLTDRVITEVRLGLSADVEITSFAAVCAACGADIMHLDEDAIHITGGMWTLRGVFDHLVEAIEMARRVHQIEDCR